MKIKSKLVKTLNKISTLPDRSSWEWEKYTSLFTFLLLGTIWLVRLFSLLQIVKNIFRRLGHSKKDILSKRSNVPPLLQEMYFLLWFACYLVMHFFGVKIDVLNYYYIIESSIWVLYYTVFRRFYEERYSIYHPLEYFVIILLIIPTQAIAVSQIYHIAIKQALLVLIGNGNDRLPVYVNLLGVLYLAIALSMIMTSFPTEKRKSEKSLKVAIIGSGDVVRSKILPAILKVIHHNAINIFSDQCPENLNENVKFNKISNMEDTIKDISKSQMVWIATPSNTHMYYLERLLSINNFIVVEKPITVIKDELIILKRITQSKYRDKIFFLSYYILEKALPLIYITQPSTYYEKYLDISCEKNSLFSTMNSLGSIKDIGIFIIEGKDDRNWVHSYGNGGQLLETFIHNLMIASKFVGLPNNWSEIEISYGGMHDIKGYKSPNVIQMEAVSNSKQILLLMAKNIADESKHKKGAYLEYQNGKITADFKKQRVHIKCYNPKKEITIGVKKEYCGKYDIQVDLAINCFDQYISPEFVDGLDNQIEIIEWLLQMKEKEDKFNILNFSMVNSIINDMVIKI